MALWLGYEVREARHLEQTITALRALGGTVETELTGPSLLRLCRVPGYGRRIVLAEVPGAAVEEAIPLLSGLSGLREVDVVYDGTFDPTPGWQAIHESLNVPTIVSKSLEEEGPLNEAFLMDDARWEQSPAARRLARFRARIKEAYSKKFLNGWLPDSYLDYAFQNRTLYRPLCLAHGTLAELLTCEQTVVSTPGSQLCFAVLIVSGKCVGIKEIAIGSRSGSQRIVLEDFDKDGVPDVGFQLARKGWLGRPKTGQIPGDSRNWLGVYKIERDGFKSLLPQDESNLP